MVPCPSLSSPANSGVSDRSRCGAVPMLERFRRRGEGGGGERGRREEEGGSREEEEEGGGRREEGGREKSRLRMKWGRELLLDEVEEAVALGHRRVVGEVPGVERREVVAAQIAPVRFRLGVGVAGELERGVREDGGVTLVRTRDSKLPLALTAPAMASSISVWVRELVQYCRKVAVSWESSSVRG